MGAPGPREGRDGAEVTQRPGASLSRLPPGPDSFINLAPLVAPDGSLAHLQGCGARRGALRKKNSWLHKSLLLPSVSPEQDGKVV